MSYIVKIEIVPMKVGTYNSQRGNCIFVAVCITQKAAFEKTFYIKAFYDSVSYVPCVHDKLLKRLYFVFDVSYYGCAFLLVEEVFITFTVNDMCTECHKRMEFHFHNTIKYYKITSKGILKYVVVYSLYFCK